MVIKQNVMYAGVKMLSTPPEMPSANALTNKLTS